MHMHIHTIVYISHQYLHSISISE